MKYLFELYVSGKGGRSLQAIRNLEEISRMFPDTKCDIKIIDIQENPQLAVEERILAIPTLVQKFPPPPRKIVGDLSVIKDVIFHLDLNQQIITNTESNPSVKGGV